MLPGKVVRRPRIHIVVAPRPRPLAHAPARMLSPRRRCQCTLARWPAPLRARCRPPLFGLPCAQAGTPGTRYSCNAHMHPENADIDAWQQKDAVEEVLEPDLEIVDPVSFRAIDRHPIPRTVWAVQQHTVAQPPSVRLVSIATPTIGALAEPFFLCGAAPSPLGLASAACAWCQSRR
eukprot:COSAG03_NODE_92_length_13295_cov_193.147014_4_plen_177_part_00